MARPNKKKNKFSQEEIEKAKNALLNALENDELTEDELQEIVPEFIDCAQTLEDKGVEFMPEGEFLGINFGE